jgi:hypothetical protein
MPTFIEDVNLDGTLFIARPWADWIFLRQKRDLEGGGGFHTHNPWGAEVGVQLALNGKVHAKVAADTCPIELGDLLTTSSVSGQAMKAADATRSLGSIIGKALAPLPEGQGLISILVSLH